MKNRDGASDTQQRAYAAFATKLFDNLPFVRANIVRILSHGVAGLRDFGLTDIDMALAAPGTIKDVMEQGRPLFS